MTTKLPNDVSRCASKTCEKRDQCLRSVLHRSETGGHYVSVSDFTEICVGDDYAFLIPVEK